MINQNLLITLFILWIASDNFFAIAEIDPLGNNVCIKNISKTRIVQVKKTYTIDVFTFRLCKQFPFRCKVKTTENRISTRPENQTIQIPVPYCCDGYVEDGEKCKPYCPNSCVHGECSEPNVCDCQLGTGGPSCNTTCPESRFGMHCEYDCECLMNPHCNKNYRDCSCQPGKISRECRNICKCRSPVCSPGFIGKNCQTECPPDTYGSMCRSKCACNKTNTVECLKENGDCRCKGSFFGVFCEGDCSKGKLICESPTNCKCLIESNNLLHSETDTSISMRIEKQLDGESSNQGLIFSLIALLIAVISVSMIVLHRYRTKTRKLKREVQNIRVRYSTGGSSDQFDNPVYSYAATATDTTSPSTYNSPYSLPANKFQRAPSSIQFTTLPHRPKLNGNFDGHLGGRDTSLTMPRRPRQNGYLNGLETLPDDQFLAHKNALADATNPNMISQMRKDGKSTSNAMNIYSTIDELRAEDLKSTGDSYKFQFESEFKDDFDDHFVINRDKSSINNPFNKSNDTDSVDIQFMQLTNQKSQDDKALDVLFSDLEKNNLLQHYDKPKSPSKIDQNEQDKAKQSKNLPIYEVPRSSNEIGQTAQSSNEIVQTTQPSGALATDLYETLEANKDQHDSMSTLQKH